jgi:VIT1/CCC1 family predicted Fe2+/Mn2+ transporter
LTRHHEAHRTDRTAWLRAAVLGADDGLVSIASLMIGVAAASASNETILVAGSMSMAVGEYVSVSSQRDSRRRTSSVKLGSSRVTQKRS